MAKVLEGPGMGLMKKWGIHVPNYAWSPPQTNSPNLVKPTTG